MPFHSIQEKNGCGLDTGLAGDFEKSLSCPQSPSYESVRRSKRVGRVLRRPYRPTATYPYPHARERLHGPRRAFPRVPTPPMASTIGTPPMASTRAHATDGFHDREVFAARKTHCGVWTTNPPVPLCPTTTPRKAPHPPKPVLPGKAPLPHKATLPGEVTL